MMRKVNNKGYMLVEIIVAFSLAIAIMYLITELTVKVKNRNDDLRVRTLTASDQAIIYNMIMDDVRKGNIFSCKDSSGNDIISGRKITYNGKTNIVNEYVDEFSCSGNIIHIGVKVLDDTFDVVIPTTAVTGDEPEGSCPSNFLYPECDYSKVIGVGYALWPSGLYGTIGDPVSTVTGWVTGIDIVRYFGWKPYAKPDYITNPYCDAHGGLYWGTPTWPGDYDCTDISNIDIYECYPEETKELLATTCSISFNDEYIQESGTELTIEVNGFSQTFSVEGRTS